MRKPTAVKKWETMVADFGCVVTKEPDIQLHHVFGRTYKHRKVHIGQFYILPLAIRYHDVSSNNPFNVTYFPKRFAIEFGYQRSLFAKMCKAMVSCGTVLPFGDEVMDAIMDSPLR